MTTFNDYADRFETTMLPMKKPASIATISSHLRAHLRPVFGQMSVGEIGYPAVQAFVANLAKSAEPKTVKNIWGTLRLLLTQAQREGLCPGVPNPVLPKNGRRVQEWLTAEQMRNVIASAPAPYNLFCAVLGETGARIGEVLGLQWRDLSLRKYMSLDFHRSIYNGKPQSMKTSNSQRIVCLSNWLFDWLNDWCAQDNGKPGAAPDAYIFRTSKGTPWWPGDVSRVLSNIYTLNGIEPMGFHSWRRGNIVLCAKVLGIPEAIIAQRVGHAAEGMTLGVYAAATVRFADREWVEKIAEAIKP